MARLPPDLRARYRVETLTGSVRGKSRDKLLASLETSTAGVLLVGTHALVADAVLPRLTAAGVRLAVIDEEQRFGVNQRSALSEVAAHALFMSATPIPRSLALGGASSDVVTGLLDVTTMTAKPRSSRKVQTSIVALSQVSEVMNGVKRQVAKGAKVFWVLPLIGLEEQDLPKPAVAEKGEAVVASALSRHAELSKVRPPPPPPSPPTSP